MSIVNQNQAREEFVQTQVELLEEEYPYEKFLDDLKSDVNFDFGSNEDYEQALEGGPGYWVDLYYQHLENLALDIFDNADFSD